jgi:hypothetical protein
MARESESIFRPIFRHAFRRAWGLGAMSLETLSWSIAVVFLGLRVFDLTSEKMDAWASLAALAVFVAVTPVVIAVAILRAHVSVGTADEALRNAPVKPIEMIGPRTAAVAAVWLQLLAPWLLIDVLSHFSLSRFTSYPAGMGFTGRAAAFLVMNAYWATDFRVQLAHYTGIPGLLVLLLGFFQAAGWVLLPMAWGFMWASVFRHKGAPFLMAYSSYLLMPLLLYAIVGMNLLGIRKHDYLTLWPMVFIVGLGGVALSMFFFFLACRLWARRTG